MTQSAVSARMPMWDEKRLRAANDAAGAALWSWNVDADVITLDERGYDLWQVSKDETEITFEILSANIHPADLERVQSAFSATGAVLSSYEIDFRILNGSDVRWISARGQRNDADIAHRTFVTDELGIRRSRPSSTQRKAERSTSAQVVWWAEGWGSFNSIMHRQRRRFP
jgi:PAS domain-containing protein